MKPKNVIIFVLSFILVSWLFGGMVYAQESESQNPAAPPFLPEKQPIPPQSDKVYDPEYKPQDVQAGPAEEGFAVEGMPYLGGAPREDIRKQLARIISFIAIINFILGVIALLTVKKKLHPSTVSQGKKRFLYTYITLNCVNLICSLAWIFGTRFFLYETFQPIIVVSVGALFFSWGMGVINILSLIVTGVRRLLKRFRKKDQQTAV